MLEDRCLEAAEGRKQREKSREMTDTFEINRGWWSSGAKALSDCRKTEYSFVARERLVDD